MRYVLLRAEEISLCSRLEGELTGMGKRRRGMEISFKLVIIRRLLTENNMLRQDESAYPDTLCMNRVTQLDRSIQASRRRSGRRTMSSWSL